MTHSSRRRRSRAAGAHDDRRRHAAGAAHTTAGETTDAAAGAASGAQPEPAASGQPEPAEYTSTARDPQRRDKMLKALPLLIAALGALPLLWLSLRFSLLVGQISYYVILMGTSALNIIGMVMLTLLGVLGLIGTIVCLWRGFTRRTWRWRIGWAAGALACAAALPVSWVLLGLTDGSPV